VGRLLGGPGGGGGGGAGGGGGGGAAPPDIMPLSMLNLFDTFPLFCDTDDGCISDALVRY
jgi:hypothetical protein